MLYLLSTVIIVAVVGIASTAVILTLVLLQEPKWSGVPQGVYSFEVLKGGIIVETVPLNRPFIVIGRQSQCDMVLEHPSLSR